MTRRRFALVIVFWLVALAICASDLGGLVGFLAGVAVAMYGGVAGVALQQGAAALGLRLSWTDAGAILLWGTVAAFALAALLSAGRGLGRAVHHDEAGALSAWAKTISFCAFPIALWLSAASLARTWP